MKKILKKLELNPVTRIPYKTLVYLKENGIKATSHKALFYLSVKQRMRKALEKKLAFTENDRLVQEKTKFSKDIKFSILVPLYNTPENFLREMIESVQSQTYKNWELCLADGSTKDFDFVEKISLEYADKDSRIIYKKLEKNLGISENTNECIKMSSGEYIALFDHDDLLHPAVLYFYMKEICENNADFIYCDELIFEKSMSKIKNVQAAHFKPDFAIDNLRSFNYITHFSVFSRELQEKVGMFNKELDGSQDHDMILRLTEKAEKIAHVSKVLYFWRAHNNSVAKNVDSKSYAIEAGQKAVFNHLKRCGIETEGIESTKIASLYRIKYKLLASPLVSVLIPNMDNKDVLERCINSIIEKSTYKNYEIIIVENNSKKQETFDYYKSLELHKNIQVVTYKTDGTFNYSKINNYGVNFCSGEHIILLNNDIEVITENWIEEMLMFSQRKDVGIVGAKLYYPNNKIQHAGVVIGLGGAAAHIHKDVPREFPGYMGKLYVVQNYSAVTAACFMVKKDIYKEVLGLDEENFAVAYNDVDFCLKVRELGLLVCLTPFAELYHHESVTRGYEDSPEKKARFEKETNNLRTKWAKIFENGDPYYNINLTKDRDNYSIDVREE
ncbi:MAG: glycosyltransferase [Clostridia bacterium]